MATPSYKWYQTSVLAWMWDEEAIRNSWSEVPWYEMFANTWATTTSTSTDTNNLSKNREVEIGLWKSVYGPMSDMEKTEYVNSLTDDQYRQMQKYKNQWYSFEASRTLLENSDWLANPIAQWVDKYQPKWNFFKNMVAWAYDSVTWLPRFLSDNLAKAVWWTAKKLWADEDKVNELVQSYIDFGKNEMSWKALWANTNSATYKITKWVWDIAQVAAWEWLAKGALKWTQALNKINQVKNSGLLGKMAVWAAEWAADMWLYSVVSESELPTWKDLAVWATLWAVFPAAWVWLKAGKKLLKGKAKTVAAKLELNWLINPSKLDKVRKQLIAEWTDLAEAWLRWWTPKDVWTWLVERGFKGEKQKIVDDLWERASKAWQYKRDILSKSTSLHRVDAAEKALKETYEEIKWVVWLEKEIAKVEELMARPWGQYKLSELEEILNTFDDYVKIFDSNWQLKSRAETKWLGYIRYELKKYIEDVATKEWLWNIKMLNNEIQVSKALADWISKKDNSDAVREILSMFGKYAPGWIAGWVIWWPFDKDTMTGRLWNMIVGAFVGKYIFSTSSKTRLAAWLNKLSWWTKKELERWMAWDIKSISKKAEKELFDILQDVEALPAPTNTINDAWKTIIPSEESIFVWTPEWETIIRDVATQWAINEIK